MFNVTTNLINRLNEKVIEEVPLLVGYTLWRYKDKRPKVMAGTHDTREDLGHHFVSTCRMSLPCTHHSPPCADGRSLQL